MSPEADEGWFWLSWALPSGEADEGWFWVPWALPSGTLVTDISPPQGQLWHESAWGVSGASPGRSPLSWVLKVGMPEGIQSGIIKVNFRHWGRWMYENANHG